MGAINVRTPAELVDDGDAQEYIARGEKLARRTGGGGEKVADTSGIAEVDVAPEGGVGGETTKAVRGLGDALKVCVVDELGKGR